MNEDEAGETVDFDLEVAARMTDGDLDLLRTLTWMFLEEVPSRVERVRLLSAARNPHLLKREAHSLKGVAGLVGLVSAQQAARALEDAIEAGETDPAALELLADELVARLVAGAAAARAALS